MPNRRPEPVQHFIYPLTQSGGYYFDELDGGDEITPENYWKFALVGATVEWHLSNGYRLIAPGDWVWAYFGESVRRICGVGTVRSAVGWRRDWGLHTVHIRWNPKLTRRLREDPVSYYDYGQQVQAPVVRANDITLQVLTAWLDVQNTAMPTQDRAVKFAERSVAQRLGQPRFRDDVLQAFGGQCAVTGAPRTGFFKQHTSFQSVLAEPTPSKTHCFCAQICTTCSTMAS